MCHVRHVDHPCKHFKCSLWTFCEDYRKLPHTDREAMERNSSYRCPKDEPVTEEVVTVSKAKAAIVTSLDRATKFINRSLPVGIQFPSAGYAECHKGHVLSKMIVDTRWSKLGKLAAIVKELKEDTSAKERPYVEGRTEDNSQENSVKHLLGLMKAQDDLGMMMMHEPFITTECRAILFLGRRQGESGGAEESSDDLNGSEKPSNDSM